jgi:hypothetical protein
LSLVFLFPYGLFLSNFPYPLKSFLFLLGKFIVFVFLGFAFFFPSNHCTLEKQEDEQRHTQLIYLMIVRAFSLLCSFYPSLLLSFAPSLQRLASREHQKSFKKLDVDSGTILKRNTLFYSPQKEG